MAFENTDDINLLFIGKKLSSIKLYQINDEFIVLNPTKSAVIDGGVELDFEGSKLVIGWNSKDEWYDSNTSSFSSLIGKLDYYQIDSNELPLGKNLIGHKVNSLTTKWNWFQKLNNKMDAIGSHQYVLQEIVFTFEKGRTLQIATIHYDIENNTINNVLYDSYGELLLSVDEIVEISIIE